MSYRWMIISKNSCSFKASLQAYFLASLLNIILPGRLGELSRLFFLKKFFKIPYNNSFAIFTLDRSFDVLFIALATIFGIGLLVSDNAYSYYLPMIFIIFLTLFFYLIKQKKEFIFYLLRYIPSRFLKIYIKKIIITISKTLTLSIFFSASFYTSLVWFINASFFIVFLKYVVNFDLSITQYFLVYLASAIGMAIPIAPAGVGTFHLAVIYMLTSYGIVYEKAVATAILLHIIQIIPSIIGGYFVIISKDLKGFKDGYRL